MSTVSENSPNSQSFSYIEKRNGRIIGVSHTPQANNYTRSIPQPRKQKANIAISRIQAQATETELTYAEVQQIARARFGTDRAAALEAYTLYENGDYRLELK